MKNIFLVLAFFAILIQGCTSDEPGCIIEEANSAISIAPYDATVSEFDIETAVNALKKTGRARSTSYTLETINDDFGMPQIYVVNFNNNEGFVLLSATKNYQPVLAYALTGHFNTAIVEKTGLSEWQNATMDYMRYRQTLPPDSLLEARTQWDILLSGGIQTLNKLDQKDNPDTSSPEYQAAQRILMDSIQMWNSKGYTVIDINDNFLDDPSKCQQIREGLQGYIDPIYYNEWMLLSVAVKKNESQHLQVSDLLKSTWDQANNYNMAFPPYTSDNHYLVGCGPVALGQIMRFFRWPNTYNWDDMPLQKATETTSRFLLDVANRCKASFGFDKTSVSFDDVLAAVKSFGYTAKKYNEARLAPIKENLSLRKPVLMSGFKNKGHIWVVGGFMIDETYQYTNIYSFPSLNKLDVYSTEDFKDNSAVYYYINWGWNGQDNGFFSFSYIFSNSFPYSNDQHIIGDITPQK